MSVLSIFIGVALILSNVICHKDSVYHCIISWYKLVRINFCFNFKVYLSTAALLIRHSLYFCRGGAGFLTQGCCLHKESIPFFWYFTESGKPVEDLLFVLYLFQFKNIYVHLTICHHTAMKLGCHSNHPYTGVVLGKLRPRIQLYICSNPWQYLT